MSRQHVAIAGYNICSVITYVTVYTNDRSDLSSKGVFDFLQECKTMHNCHSQDRRFDVSFENINTSYLPRNYFQVRRSKAFS